ncbi:MAG: GNAT family N-acetyltransferase [Acidimicrobiales bacterium]
MSDTTLAIRRCVLGDWNELRAIRLEALADTPAAYGSTYDECRRWSDQQWMNAASRRLFFLAERDGVVVGMVSGGFNDGHPGTRWLYGIYVSPSARGTDTATRLAETVCGWARDEGVDEIYLHVTSILTRALAFYEKVGFRPTGDSVAMDRDPSLTLITMVRDLD